MTPQDQLKQLMATLQKNAEANAKARQDTDRNTYLTQIGRFFGAAIQPLKEAVEEMKRTGANLSILSSRLNNLEIPKPEVNVDLSSIRIPTPNVTVKPIVDISTIKMPDEMNVKGWIGLMGYDRGLLTNPIPVQIRDATGKPIDLSGSLTQFVGGGGGGGNHVIVDNLSSLSITSSGSSSISLVNADGTYYNSDNPLPVSATITPSDDQPVSQISGAIWSTESHTHALDSSGAWEQVRTDAGIAAGAMRVVQAVDAVSSVSIVSNIASLDVRQTSGAINSVNMMQTAGNATVVGTGYQDNALRVVNATDAITSVNNTQWNGNAIPVGTGYQDNALRVVNATDAITSVNIVSSATITVTGSLTSSVAVGSVVGDAVDDGSAPVQMGGIARTANPTAVAGGDVVKASMDDLGRQITRPVQVRDLISTAYVSITNGTEATLKSAVAGSYLDLIYVLGTNNSDAAVTVDIRAVTAGNIATSIRIPANGTAGVSLPVPIPQDETGNNWTADLPDITGTTVTLSALFSREI